MVVLLHTRMGMATEVGITVIKLEAAVDTDRIVVIGGHQDLGAVSWADIKAGQHHHRWSSTRSTLDQPSKVGSFQHFWLKFFFLIFFG